MKDRSLANITFIVNNEKKNVVSLGFNRTCAKLFFGHQFIYTQQTDAKCSGVCRAEARVL